MLGALSVLIWYTANTSLGTSTTFSRAAGMVLSTVAPEHVASNVYYKLHKPIVDWQFMLVLGIPVGAYLAARLSRGRIQFTTKLPEAWVSRFGTSKARRWTIGIVGGSLWFFKEQPFVLLFLVLGVGTWFGRLKLGFLSLGSTAATLLVGIVVSAVAMVEPAAYG